MEKRELIKQWLSDNFIGKYTIDFNDKDEIIINGNITLDNNLMEELEYKFAEINGDFNLGGEKFPGEGQTGYRNLKTLKNCPETVKGSFSIYHNENLNTLEYGPSYVGGTYSCAACGLENLNGIAKHIGGYLSAYTNKKLKDISALDNISINGYIDLEFSDPIIRESLTYKDLQKNDKLIHDTYKNFRY